jgi:predicted nucleic acid-binding protein
LKAAYVDTSCLVAIAFDEPERTEVASRLGEHEMLLSSNLLEAEFRAALARESADLDEALFSWITWVLPDRPLSAEITRVLGAAYLRGADLWHLSMAIYVTSDPADLTFLTLDQRQREVAEALGFRVPA